MDELLEERTKIFANIKSVMKVLVEKQEEEAEDAAAKARELFNEFNDLLSKARNQLISKKIILHDQIEVHAYDINLLKMSIKLIGFRKAICFLSKKKKDINEVFRINMTSMVDSFLETARGHFSLLRNAEIEYNNVINGLVLHYLNSFEDETHIPFHLKNLCCDEDTLATTLAASNDIHLQVNIENIKLLK